MKNKIAKIIYGIIFVALIFFISFFVINKMSKKESIAKVISSNFIGYDFARAVIGDSNEISMLLKPGAEAHNFEPTPEDIINIKSADLFIYVGGESDTWVKKLLEDNEIPIEKTLRLMDLVELKIEEVSENMEHESEYDEHIWTSPVNAKKLVAKIKDKLTLIYPDRQTAFNDNYKKYAERLEKIDQSFRDIVAASNKKVLIFGDRFPFRYFVDEYNLRYYAAFPGCSEQTEASSSTIAFLIDKAKENNVHVILKNELTSDKLAKTIADETGAKVMELNSAHNVSQTNFEKGVTYADLMETNLKILEEALK